MEKTYTKDEITEIFDLEDGTIFLEPCEVFNNGILGVTEDKKHIVYGYNTLLASLAESYEEEYSSKCDEQENCLPDCEPDFYNDAAEWIDYNTIRSLPYMDAEHKPIIIYELNDDK